MRRQDLARHTKFRQKFSFLRRLEELESAPELSYRFSMLFNSLQFAIFFPIVTALYFLLPQRFRWAMLLLASCYFYMAFVPKYILILFAIILIDYFAAIAIEASEGRKRKMFLWVSLAANIGILGVFKYFNFFNQNLAELAQAIGWNYGIANLSILLPIGLSFHTFQAMSYTFEVYYGREKAERHLGIYALYVLYYPQLVAGPIERPQNLLHQFHTRHRFDMNRVVNGLILMAWGLLKKVVIADRLALTVNPVFQDPDAFSTGSLWIAAVFFSFQIFCDFSGYSDIAIGASRVMGIELMKNFDRPYFATNIAIFWRRWHISLSTWFRDYLYIPLGGSRGGEGKTYRNLLIVFLVSGLWHGANWTYVIWGGIHGFAVILYMYSASLRSKCCHGFGLGKFSNLRAILSVSLTFLVVTVAWVYFRAESVSIANHIVSRMLGWADGSGTASVFTHESNEEIFLSFLLLVFLNAFYLLRTFKNRLSEEIFLGGGRIYRWGIAYALVIVIAVLGKFDLQQFIYFQF